MSNAGQVVPTEVWADTSAQLDCESAPAFGLPQNAVGPCHPGVPCPIPGTSAAPLLSAWLIPCSFSEALPGPQLWALFSRLHSFGEALCISYPSDSCRGFVGGVMLCPLGLFW